MADHAFGTGDPFTIGVEEELFLVDPVTGRQTNTSAGVLGRLGQLPGGRIEPELHECQVELITDPHATVAAAVTELRALRSAVVSTGAGILGSGTHPSSSEGEATITDRERYEHISALLGDAIVTPVAGLHVHVGMPDPETAIRVFNGLRDHLPLLQALSANSPYRHGRDSGLASAREMSLRTWPRSGVPRALADFADFTTMSDELAHAAGVEDYTYFWWKIRPHPRLGTVEVRALDAQTSVDDVGALVALVQCLARALARQRPGHTGTAAAILDEGIFRAGRFGTQAELIQRDTHRPVSALLEELIGELADTAQELGCTGELCALPALLADGGGAGRQREIGEVAGIDAVTRVLAQRTAGARFKSAQHG